MNLNNVIPPGAYDPTHHRVSPTGDARASLKNRFTTPSSSNAIIHK